MRNFCVDIGLSVGGSASSGSNGKSCNFHNTSSLPLPACRGGSASRTGQRKFPLNHEKFSRPFRCILRMGSTQGSSWAEQKRSRTGLHRLSEFCAWQVWSRHLKPLPKTSTPLTPCHPRTISQFPRTPSHDSEATHQKAHKRILCRRFSFLPIPNVEADTRSTLERTHCGSRLLTVSGKSDGKLL